MVINMYIDGQVRLVRLQTDNFRLFLRQKMVKRQTFFARWANGKRIQENRMGFSFPYETAASVCVYLYMYRICVYTCTLNFCTYWTVCVQFSMQTFHPWWKLQVRFSAKNPCKIDEFNAFALLNICLRGNFFDYVRGFVCYCSTIVHMLIGCSDF